MDLIRVGIIGFDTSHAVEFTKRINHVGISEDQWVDGAKVVIGWPGGPSSFVSDEVLSQRTKQLQEFGVRIVDSPDDLIGEVDAVLLELQEGSQHLKYAKPFIEAEIPLFIDKPFTCSVSDAKKIVELAHSRNVPIFSSSSLRYALEIQELRSKKDLGEIYGAETYSPAHLHPKNPGLFNYGIHGVEMLYAIMGAGCKFVRCTHDERWDVVVGVWHDGRIGVFRGIRKGALGYGFTAFCEKAVVSSSIDMRYIYRELLKKIVEMFQTHKMPIDPKETVEIMAFMEASIKSAEKGSDEYLINIDC